jgi:type II restriction enzyme
MWSELAERYVSPTQRARVLSEAWASNNLYCPCCPADSLGGCDTRREAVDFVCQSCAAHFQLKSSKGFFGNRVVDGAFAGMFRAMQSGQAPHLLLLGYDASSWCVRQLTLVPGFALTMSCIEKRAALKNTARRAGWVGCNILLESIPKDARIAMVSGRRVVPPAEIRRRYARLKPLEKLDFAQRGWTLDVLNVVRAIGRPEFTLKQVYEFSSQFGNLHPKNRHIHAKIRQQLQKLRDLGFIGFLGEGQYSLTR